MPSVRTLSISKKFPEGTEALSKVNLQVNDGELMALVGPSGCGKTTLLRIIAGLESASGGELFFGDQKVSHLPPERRDLGMVFQNYALFPHLSVSRNILLGLESSALSKIEKQRTVEDVAESLGILPLLERKPSEISGGQRQRVALARLLAHNPSIHLLDEPLSNLDANLRIQMREELVKLHQKNRKTTLFVTHDQVEAMTLGERICLLNNGKIEQIGSPREIYDTPANLFVAGFFGIPSINLLPGKLEAQPGSNTCDFLCKNSSVRFAIPSLIQTESKDLILGIRPEKIQIDKECKANSFEIMRTEYHGDSQIFFLQSQDLSITCKQTTTQSLDAQKAGISIDWTSVLWFEPKSGQRVQLRES